MENYSSMIYKIDGSLFHQLHKCYSVPRNVKKRYENLREQFYTLIEKRNNTYCACGEFATLYIDEFKNLYHQFVKLNKDVQKLNLVERIITII